MSDSNPLRTWLELDFPRNDILADGTNDADLRPSLGECVKMRRKAWRLQQLAQKLLQARRAGMLKHLFGRAILGDIAIAEEQHA